MIKEYTGEFEFARLIFPAPAELVTDFSPKNLASFTIGQQTLGSGRLNTNSMEASALPHIKSVFGKKISSPAMPKLIREGLPGIATDIEPIAEDELALLKKVVHCWPRFGDEGSELYVRMDHIWTPTTEALADQPKQGNQVIVLQVETLFDENPAA